MSLAKLAAKGAFWETALPFWRVSCAGWRTGCCNEICVLAVAALSAAAASTGPFVVSANWDEEAAAVAALAEKDGTAGAAIEFVGAVWMSVWASVEPVAVMRRAMLPASRIVSRSYKKLISGCRCGGGIESNPLRG